MKARNSAGRKIIFQIMILLAVGVFYLAVHIASGRKYNCERDAEKMSQNLKELSVSLDSLMQNVLSSGITKTPAAFFSNDSLLIELDSDQVSLFVFEHDSLVFWSNEQTPVPYLAQDLDRCMIFNGNGYYYTRTEVSGKYQIIVLLLIQQKFQYQNEYLPQKFNPDVFTGNQYIIAGENDSIVSNVTLPDGQNTFSLSLRPDTKKNTTTEETIVFILIFLSFILMISGLYRTLSFYRWFRTLKIWRWLVLTTIPILFFYLSDYLINLNVFSHLSINNPELFALSERFNNLFSLLIFLFWALILLIFMVREFLLISGLKRKSILLRQILLIFSNIATVLLSCLSLQFLDDILFNSSISLVFNDIFTVNESFLYVFLILFLIFASIILLHYVTIVLLLRMKISFRAWGIYVLISVLILLILTFIIQYKASIVFGIFAYIVLMQFVFTRKLKKSKALYIFIHIFFISAFSTIIINDINFRKQTENLNLLTLKLATEQDPLAEDIYDDVKPEIESDTVLLNKILEDDPEFSISEYLKSTHFSGYLSQYLIQTTLCREDEDLIVQPANEVVSCLSFFEELALIRGIPTLASDLYFIDDGTGRGNYLAILTLGDSINTRYLFIELIPPSYETGLGYPDLLVDKDSRTRTIPSNMSYARYLNGELINHYGKYRYSTVITNEMAVINDGEFIQSNGYIHLKTKLSDNLFLVLTVRDRNFMDKIAPFTYLFIIFTLFTAIFLLLSGRLWNIKLRWKNTFSSRLRWMVLFVMVLSFFVAGIIAMFNMNSLNSNKNSENISEKAHSLLIELENKLKKYDSLRKDDQEYLSSLMLKFSGVFFTDINVYGLDGDLIATSRAQIFYKNLISSYMNPIAYTSLAHEHNSFFSQTEFIGKMAYTSAYVPVRNINNKVIAYLNLPYFAREEELSREISLFMTTFINIYLIMILLTIMITVIISNYVTHPLRMIKEKLRTIKLGSVNEKIAWKKKDEIGELVFEYNRMIDELAEKAELLARNEREMAWREMAKQVAHEIKNPLTPMKLSTQYLERAWQDGSEDFDERLKRFTSTMIEQINNLSEIASEFSNFGKMPESKVEKICINDIISGVITLFRSEDNDIVFEQPDEALYIMGDESRILRVFNNLFKNAQQAFVADRRGKISVQLSRIDNRIQISVSDNGSGVPEDVKRRIFQPNFTTKSSGTGLGLAMVKNILTEMGGSISFESKAGEGTTFFIELPLV
ncbi:MAG: hypothetical protein JXR53_03725 [Bacteroidales bacterium]|nr:hypothetical protein [Bacteroidales bacterium]